MPADDVSFTSGSNSLTTKVGPLPLYGWGIILAGATLGFLYLRRSRRGNSSLFGGDTGDGGGSGRDGVGGVPVGPQLPTDPIPITPDDFCLVSGSDSNGSYDCIANRKHYRATNNPVQPSPVEPDSCTISGVDSIGPYDCEGGRKVRRSGKPIPRTPGADAEACIRAGGYWTKRGNMDGPGAWYCASEPLR